MKTRQIVALVVNIELCVPFFGLGLLGTMFSPLIALVVILNIVLAIYCVFTRFLFAGIGGILGGIIAVVTIPSGWEGFVIFWTFPLYCLIGMFLWIAGVYLSTDFREKTEENESSSLKKNTPASDEKKWNELSPEEQYKILIK